jgi:hypothetical protein
MFTHNDVVEASRLGRTARGWFAPTLAALLL